MRATLVKFSISSTFTSLGLAPLAPLFRVVFVIACHQSYVVEHCKGRSSLNCLLSLVDKAWFLTFFLSSSSPNDLDDKSSHVTFTTFFFLPFFLFIYFSPNNHFCSVVSYYSRSKLC